MMRIGIDIDGVLTDIEKFQIEYGSKYFHSKGKSIINYKGYETTEIFGLSLKEDDDFWNIAIKDYINEPARNYASEVIRKLKEEGNEIYIITARSSNLNYTDDINIEQMQNIVKNWLKKQNIYYDKLIFSKEDKLQICLENDIDIMIEDKPSNVNELSKKIPILCYHSSYNENCTGTNIYRCYSWYDIYFKINNIL